MAYETFLLRVRKDVFNITSWGGTGFRPARATCRGSPKGTIRRHLPHLGPSPSDTGHVVVSVEVRSEEVENGLITHGESPSLI